MDSSNLAMLGASGSHAMQAGNGRDTRPISAPPAVSHNKRLRGCRSVEFPAFLSAVYATE